MLLNMSVILNVFTSIHLYNFRVVGVFELPTTYHMSSYGAMEMIYISLIVFYFYLVNIFT